MEVGGAKNISSSNSSSVDENKKIQQERATIKKLEDKKARQEEEQKNGIFNPADNVQIEGQGLGKQVAASILASIF